ncbi:hypothetical protein [Thalassobius sp. MITS945101]|uniref:hypothetical protein n=1 Tax=Thalassobius sp. MITS945101 TaxID=3096994 RepID=UPI00399C31C7
MNILYLTACGLSAVMQLFLTYTLLSDPQGMIGGFGLPTDSTVGFVARRAGVMFLGLAVLSIAAMFLQQNRGLAAFALSVPWLALAVLGSFEHLRGFVGGEIYPAIAIEATLGLLLLATWILLRSPAPQQVA